jgi:NADH:ubiquinone oxidoreductase subunit K
MKILKINLHLKNLIVTFVSILLFSFALWASGPFNMSIVSAAIAMITAGFVGVFFAYRNKNVLVFIMCIEIMLLAMVTLFLVVAVEYNEYLGSTIAMSTLALAAAETAIGLGLVVHLTRVGSSTNISSFRLALKGLIIPIASIGSNVSITETSTYISTPYLAEIFVGTLL